MQSLAVLKRITMDYQSLTLPQIYNEAEAIVGDAKTLFGHLNSQQVNWKPAADSWSVAQCLDHLISINREYYPTFDRILRGDYGKTLLHRLLFLPAMSGRFMIKILSLNSHQKYKALAVAQSSSSS